jgi:ATP-binding cassette subfamily B (MDR/TAP) protein 1
LKSTFDSETGLPGENPEDLMVALLAIMFGAMHSGQASQFGPDIGKAKGSSKTVFDIIEAPSKINAIQINENKEKMVLDPKDIKGKIEFKNVWFRYPTRKEDFVLKDLSIIINPNENVALVGESGCGKSTFVNLLMRFYDVDSGEILLDGHNIRDINLHSLRGIVSLVMQEPILFNYSILENILYGNN